MSNSRVAYRYARSILELSMEHGVLEDVRADFQLFAKTVEENRALGLLLSNPIVNHAKKLNVLKGLFGSKVHKLTNLFFEIVCRKNREGVLYGVAVSFLEQYLEHKGIDHAYITTAFPITDDLKIKVAQIVEKQMGKKVVLKEIIDPAIIGGYILHVGDQQIDDSIAGKLEIMKLKLIDHSFKVKI
jgi:F-type H+-transporting ATPase subunit delta